MDDALQQGIAALKAGDRETARKLLVTAVKQQPNSERAWGWLCNAANTDKERTDCLRQIVRINPKNEKAAQALASLSTISITTANPPLDNQNPATKSQSQSQKLSRPIWVWVILGIFVLALISIGGALSIKTYSQYSCRTDTAKYLESIEPYLVEFDDSTKLANSTTRLALGAVIQDMQRIKREITKVNVPNCARSASQLLIQGIDESIDGFLSFASSSDDDLVSYHLDQGYANSVNGVEQLKAIANGIPIPTLIVPPTPLPTAKPTPYLTPTKSPDDIYLSRVANWAVDCGVELSNLSIYSSTEQINQVKNICVDRNLYNLSNYPKKYAQVQDEVCSAMFAYGMALELMKSNQENPGNEFIVDAINEQLTKANTHMMNVNTRLTQAGWK